MRKTKRKWLALLVAFSVLLTMMPGQIARAESRNITAADYLEDDYGVKVFVANSGVEYGNVTIPRDCHFIIDNITVTIGNIEIQAGGMLEIHMDGELNCSSLTVGEINPGDPLPLIGLDIAMNVPKINGTPMNLYEIGAGDTPVLIGSDWWDRTFEYNPVGNMWLEYQEPFDPLKYSVFVDGMENVADFVVEYQSSDANWYSMSPIPDSPDFVIDGEKISAPVGDPETQNVKIRVTITNTPPAGLANRTIALAGLGDDDGRPIVNLMGEVNSTRDVLEFTVNILDGEHYPHDIHIALSYPNEGLAGITEEAKNYLYAYNTVSATTLATELYDRFIEVPMYERFGFDVLSADPGYDPAQRTSNISDLENRITVPGAASRTVSVIDKTGASSSRDVYNCTVNWGTDRHTGLPIVSTIPVIDLASSDEILVCTDWNASIGFGYTFYSRTKGTDEVQFFADGAEDTLSITVPNYGTIVAGCEGARTTTLNTDDMYSFTIGSSLVRVLKQSENYVAIVRKAGADNIDGLGDNGVETDDIWNVGTEASAKVYVGDKTIYLEPLGGASNVTTRTISDVHLKDSRMADGVTIDVSNLGKIQVDFASNFYDSVPLLITYSDNTTEELVIDRVGLVIQYIFLPDLGGGVHSYNLNYPCNGTSTTMDYKYWNADGSPNEQILVCATYYHPSSDGTTGDSTNLYLSLTYDDGNTDIITSTDLIHSFNGYIGATSGKVATTSFIIGFLHGRVLNGFDWETVPSVNFVNRFGHAGGFSATVLNAGYNNPTTFGGTQIGSGSGVYWDGRIDWYQ